ncbi:MAG: 1-acyl-sn-glycerol-3-phosphate acyltransferase [Alphaproteobacteria bacterium]|uniref:1-acyl-sn-glycerol-3-phosphate acyltransferase n=1 Tax=Candidatus Nitrobium versatile TaxID=2884831 RepID=A0A953J236_9BACT|nr:1-acyl-sn-glycerol-3-phosphate acyltransferase [Candidatus Nitrobium versatile]
MEKIIGPDGTYRTAPRTLSVPARLSPSAAFYRQVLGIVLRSSRRAKRGNYGTKEWAESSLEILLALESVGVTIEVTGAESFTGLSGPCIFVGNHMSTLETFVLPGIIAPYRDLTFVVKQSLIDYPVFRHVMRSRDPVVVGRTNPRDDLKAVLEGGTGRLQSGRSIVIFPQTTRTAVFDPSSFNTIGVKLAKKAGVPVVPIALKTDAWGNGKRLKDFGKIDPSKTVHFAFGRPVLISERGTEEHAGIIAYISGKLKEWGAA